MNPTAGLQDFQCRQLAFGLGLKGAQIAQFGKIAHAIYKLYLQRDASLVEVNPLIVTAEGNLLALDAKINIEDNALFRHPDLAAWRDTSQEDPMERKAAEHDLNYVSLDGNIACMVNGAGLAMATMDLIQLHGGKPANFLDVGGGATKERVAAAFKLILSNPKVSAILINIFGGYRPLRHYRRGHYLGRQRGGRELAGHCAARGDECVPGSPDAGKQRPCDHAGERSDGRGRESRAHGGC